MKVCDKTCIFCFFPIINKYLCMAKRSLLSRCPSYMRDNVVTHMISKIRQTIKCMLHKQDVKMLTGFICLGFGSVADFVSAVMTIQFL